MSKVCQLTGKRPVAGHSISFSNKKVKRRFIPNLHKKRFYIPEKEEWVTLRVSASAMRTIDKIGIYEFLKRQQAKGIDVGVEL